MLTELIAKDTSIILLDEDRMLIRYVTKSTNKIDFYTYNEDLLQILTGRICPDYDRRTGRTRFKTCHDGKNLHIRAHDLALGCYMGCIHAETFLQDWSEFVQYKREKCITIDHIDGQGENLTAYNLSLMDAFINRKKGSIVQKIKLPNALSAAYVGEGRYRAELITYSNADGTGAPVGSVRFLCDSPDDFAAAILRITESAPPWVVPIKRDGRWLPTEGGYLYADTARSIERQAMLAGLGESEFVRSDLLFNYVQM